jgi:hypothetical protein
MNLAAVRIIEIFLRKPNKFNVASFIKIMSAIISY